MIVRLHPIRSVILATALLLSACSQPAIQTIQTQFPPAAAPSATPIKTSTPTSTPEPSIAPPPTPATGLVPSFSLTTPGGLLVEEYVLKRMAQADSRNLYPVQGSEAAILDKHWTARLDHFRPDGRTASTPPG
jgi:hypothetical protein